ncbi:NACHT, LRR and PYD domains-containing protein 6-like isoform X2 [Engystomops pustulosus]|uniref:NACHT, LRR and PYD domains-containing protein 6-like isoform X2 n=1 Tax=Engystomops pustulosus TaxID=76066 RepID=UPI003AFB2C70
MNIVSPSDDDETQKFYQQLCHYPPHVLRTTYGFFQEDLLYIVENWRNQSLLHELIFRNIPDLEKYKDLEHDRKNLARTLLQEIFGRGREAVITLWVSLHALRKDYGSPSLDAVLEELGHRGDNLPGEILLDEEGHNLPLDLREIQNQHKKHLYEKTENLIENKPPRCNQEEESFPFCTRYVTLIIVSTHHFRERSENELIATGARHEEYVKEKHHELQRIAPNKMFRWCHRSRLVPHMVLVVGVPGVGKTTLMQKIVYDWVKGDLYQRFSFVFFFKFRELNQWDKVSLETLILHHYPYLWQQLGNILQDPEKLLFIFDGLDESNQTMDFTSRHLCSDPKQPERCGHIVVSLVRKSLLTGCSVLMTSRPTRLASMDCRVFQRMVEISGFFTEERKIYFENFFRDPELAEKAFTYVRQNDTLYTFCYLPSYCWIICTVLSRNFQTTSSDQQVSLLPRTVTQLFAIYVANILSNHSLEKSGAQKLLQSIGWMAEHGVMNHTIIFDDRDLESFHVDNKSKLLSSFLMESEEPVSYSFLHLTVQEFFSAFVHYADYSPEKLQESLEKAKSYPDGRGEMFLRFLCGLSDATTRSLLTGYLDTPAAQASRDVITWLRNFITGGEEEERLEEGEEEERPEESKYKKRLLRMFFYLFETRNKVLVQESLQSHRTLDLSDVPLSALDCTVLSFIMECCSHIEDLHLLGCSITPEGLERLAPGLHNLRDLRLGYSDLSDSSCVPLASVIRNNPDLKILDLSGNSLAGPDLSVLLEALSGLCRLEMLHLSRNNLPDTSCVPLASVIRNNPDLKILDLSGNHLPGPDLSVLLEALSGLRRLEELHLFGNNLPDTSCVPLASVIRNNPDLKTLVLSGNSLAGPDLSVLLEALSGLCRMEELYLADNNLPDTSCVPLASVIRNNPDLKTLVLTGNRLPGPDLSVLSGNRLPGPDLSVLLEALSGLCRLEMLHLGYNNLPDMSCVLLASVIRNNPDLKILDLSGNRLSGPDLRSPQVGEIWVG